MSTKTKLNKSDLKIYPSERLTDNDDGGGLALGTPLTGADNELFNPISSIARVNGGFALRLVYAGVQRDDDEPLLGAFTAITKPPKDPTVSYLLAKANKFGEVRKEIIQSIEAYSVATIESRMTLLSTQSKNSRIVQAYQSVGEPIPLVGDVYCLKQDKNGYEQAEQYIKVINISSETRTFTDDKGDFEKVVVKMEISQPLTYGFVGADYPSRYYIDNPCKVRETHVADAGAYYGIKPLVRAIKQNQMTVQVSSLMEKLVPTTQNETLLTDLLASGLTTALFDGAKEAVVLNVNTNASSLYAGSAIMPNSLLIQTNGESINDSGGTLYQGGQAVGAVDYYGGHITLNQMYVRSLTYRPASTPVQVADTAKIAISENTRSYNYVVNLPDPQVGTVSVAYRSQGKWYRLTDNGSGVLSSGTNHGSGNLNLATGTLSITCGELPDVGSAIVITWGTKAVYNNRSNLAPAVKTIIKLPTTPDPSSIRLSFGGQSASVGGNGLITGAVTGRFEEDTLYLDSPISEVVTVSYNTGDKVQQTHQSPVRGLDGRISLSLGDVPIIKGTLTVSYPLSVEGYDEIALGAVLTRNSTTRSTTTSGDGTHTTYNVGTVFATLKDDGLGKLYDSTGKEVGTVNYDTRTITFNPDTTVAIPKAKYQNIKIGEKLLNESISVQSDSNNPLSRTTHSSKTWQDVYRTSFTGFDYEPAGATLAQDGAILLSFYDQHPSSSHSDKLPQRTSVKFDIKTGELIVPSSLRFVMNGKTYFDKEGGIYSNLNPQTGAADKVGTVDYATGEITITDPIGVITVQSLTTSIDAARTDSITLLTPSAPIRPASLTIKAVALDGTKITATANTKGEFDSENVSGFVDVEYGLAVVKFGKWIEAAGQESQSWYHADAVIDGQIFKPLHVFSSSITYSTVAYSYLPVDSTTIKIDTVRLPQDGRVPIFRRGDTILITNSHRQELGSAHQGGQTVMLERQNLDSICITDSQGKAVEADKWDYDLDAGSITWQSPLDLSGYVMPIVAVQTWQERNRIQGVDIDGTLTLIFPTKRDYPLENTYVSSVLIGGDLQVRASVPFSQRNWTNVWQDTRIGDEPLNRLNVKDYPIRLTDDGAITEKWLIRFTSGNQFELYGQTLGFVARTDTLQDLAPINPSTGKPYFTLDRRAFGVDSPWGAQEVVRFNTWGTLLPVWVICAVQPSSDNPKGSDGYTQVLFGDTTEN